MSRIMSSWAPTPRSWSSSTGDAGSLRWCRVGQVEGGLLREGGQPAQVEASLDPQRKPVLLGDQSCSRQVPGAMRSSGSQVIAADGFSAPIFWCLLCASIRRRPVSSRQ